jgi:hypothetical protein
MLKHTVTQYLDTARAVFVLNEHIRERFKDTQELAEWMFQLAERELGNRDATYVGTYGFYITSYKCPADPPGTMRTISTIASYLVR